MLEQDDIQKLEAAAQSNADANTFVSSVIERIPANLRPVAKTLQPADLVNLLLADVPADSFLHTARGQRWLRQGCELLKKSL